MSTNQRTHIRIKIAARVFIEVAAATEDTPAQLQRCDIVDVSYGGCSARTDIELTPGSILSLCADLPASEPLYLAAEVKWVQQDPSEPDKWLTGFEVLRSTDTDVDTWRQLLENV